MKHKQQQRNLSILNNNLYSRITSLESILNAYDKCLKNTKPSKRIYYMDKNKYVAKVQEIFASGHYRVKFRKSFEIIEGRKLRLITPMTFVDKMIQECILAQIEPIFIRAMIPNTFQSIKGRGIHRATTKIFKDIKKLAKHKDLLCPKESKIDKNIREQYRGKTSEVYYLHTDIKKYYHNVDRYILMDILKKKIFCEKTLELIWGCIAERGVVIGANISQYLANIYLYKIDHKYYGLNSGKWNAVKYFRYADDMIFLCRDRDTLEDIKKKLAKDIKALNLQHSMVEMGRIISWQEKKDNPHFYTLDSLGYVFYKDTINVRDSIKKKMQKALRKGKTKSIPSYVGHFKWAHSQTLLRLMGFIKVKGKWKLAYPKKNYESYKEYAKQREIDNYEERLLEWSKNYSEVLPNGSVKIDLEKYDVYTEITRDKGERDIAELLKPKSIDSATLDNPFSKPKRF